MHAANAHTRGKHDKNKKGFAARAARRLMAMVCRTANPDDGAGGLMSGCRRFSQFYFTILCFSIRDFIFDNMPERVLRLPSILAA